MNTDAGVMQACVDLGVCFEVLTGASGGLGLRRLDAA